MWEKIKNSRFADHVRNSRATYVTILTLVLAVSVLVSVTVISNRAKKKQAQSDQMPPSQSDQSTNDGSQSSPSTGKHDAVLPDLDNDQQTQQPDEQPQGISFHKITSWMVFFGGSLCWNRENYSGICF